MRTDPDADPRERPHGPLAGIRASDWVLATVLTGTGVVLMWVNLAATPADIAADLAAGTLYHLPDVNSWPMIPAFVLTTIPILWWRRGVPAVIAACLAALVPHVVLFGWVTRCGAALPLAFALAYLLGLRERGRRLAVGVALVLALVVLALVRDATTGLTPLPLCLALIAISVALGRLARSRDDAIRLLRQRTDELRRLRDERAELEVAEDRERLSRRVDDVLSSRLSELAEMAEGARRSAADEQRAAFEVIEGRSRRALEDTREVVGVLRGDAVDLAPPVTAEQLADRLSRMGATRRG